MSYCDRNFYFESLLMVSDLLASSHFESLAYYVAIPQCIKRVNFNSLTSSFIFEVLIFLSDFYFYSRLTELSEGVETNSGPNSKLDQSFSICQWNPNSIAAHNFSKIQSLIAYNCIHHFDIVSLSETYLNVFHLITSTWIYQVID